MKGARAAVLYLAVVVAVAVWMHLRHTTPGNPMEAKAMTSNTWKDIVVPAKPEGIWTWAVDYLKGPALITIEAEGKWSYSPGKDCGPDGDLEALLMPDQAILATAPVGALLVKIGGSTAGTGDGTVKVAGRKAVIEIGSTSGPLFLTINDQVSGLSDNDGELKVTISVRKLETSSSETEKGTEKAGKEPGKETGKETGNKPSGS
jgi:hypothetical protein